MTEPPPTVPIGAGVEDLATPSEAQAPAARRWAVGDLPIGEALRLLRISRGLKQVEASRLAGAPDFRTISHWETHRKIPSFKLLTGYLAALGLDFHDLQDALDRTPVMSERLIELGGQVDRLACMVEDLAERRQVVLERRLLALEQRLAATETHEAG